MSKIKMIMFTAGEVNKNATKLVIPIAILLEFRDA